MSNPSVEDIPFPYEPCICSTCGGELDVSDENPGEFGENVELYRIKCTECTELGEIGVVNGEIDHTDLRMFTSLSGEHHGQRDEHSVKYTEHYQFDEESGELEYTTDEVVGGWDSEVEYNCSCGRRFFSKEDLKRHLQAITEIQKATEDL